VKTMLRLAKESPTVSVVCDQLGSPTYAMDLAYGILQIVRSGSNHYGIYHFSNKGVTSWYEFASKVFQIKEIAVDLKPIKTKEYKTLAKRPLFSVLDTSKIELEFKLKIKSWDESLESALKEIC
jgi:dTDP-4-dehydrorhamnose reductase